MKPPHPSITTCIKLSLTLAMSLALASCQIPKNMEESRGAVTINDPEAVLPDTYEPKSDQEDDLESAIEGTVESFFHKASAEGEKEQLSSASRAAASGGPVHHEHWWAGSQHQSVLATSGSSAPMTLDEIYTRALANSSQVKVFAAIPLIRETAIDEAEGAFDPELYAQTRYDKTHEPTGSSLETGNPNDFFRERGWTFEGGVRKRFLAGTQIALAQELSQVTNNSEFFVPGEQGKSRLKLSVVQPLLRGAGTKYNRTMIQIAKLDAETGYDEFIRQLETHLMEVNRSYWALYLARSLYKEQQNLVAQTQKVANELSKRGGLDASSSQITRTNAALTERKADLVRSELAIKNSESRLRALINDPYFAEAGIGEIIPADYPVTEGFQPDFSAMVADALTFRPEVRQAEKNLKAADLREYMAEQDKKPSLDFVADAGISALRGEGDFGGAYGDQYSDSRPTWGVGLMGSVPFERKAAKARHLRNLLEVRQKKDQLRSTMDTVLLEVQVAHREVTTAFPDMKAKHAAASAAADELAVLEKRRGIDGEAGQAIYLEKLLDAQQRRTNARQSFLESLVVYNSALTNLDRAKGTLLQAEGVGIERTEDEDELPLLKLAKAQATEHAIASYESTK